MPDYGMTTVTAPPLIVPAVDVSDMPAWDQPDERACEVEIGPRCCRRLAAWVMSAMVECCGAETMLVCDLCKQDFVASGVTCITHDCTGEITRVEPLR